MKILINSENINGIQIGTVGTIPEYRNRGLSRYLMEHVIDKYDPFCNIFFLFANESVLDFYPKFGFKPYNEVIFNSSSDIPYSDYSARKLNINNNTDIDIINKNLSERLVLTHLFGATDYDFITHWHLLNVFSDNLLYVENEEVIFICAEEKDQLHIWDVIFSKPFNLHTVVSKIIKDEKLKSILYYFPTKNLNFQ
jgi:hypothetical protein